MAPHFSQKQTFIVRRIYTKKLIQIWPHAFKFNAWPLYMPYILTVGITLSVCLLQQLVWKDTHFYKTNVYEHI